MIRKDVPDLDEVMADLYRRKGVLSADAVCSFPQIWKASSLGLDTAGFASAYTTVIYEGIGNTYHVYFDGMYAFSVSDPNELFLEDLEKGTIKPGDMSYLYLQE